MNSPTPWKADIYTGLHDTNGHKVAEMVMPGPQDTCYATFKANRDLILKCVNGYPALEQELAGLKGKLADLEGYMAEVLDGTIKLATDGKEAYVKFLNTLVTKRIAASRDSGSTSAKD